MAPTHSPKEGKTTAAKPKASTTKVEKSKANDRPEAKKKRAEEKKSVQEKIQEFQEKKRRKSENPDDEELELMDIDEQLTALQQTLAELDSEGDIIIDENKLGTTGDNSEGSSSSGSASVPDVVITGGQGTDDHEIKREDTPGYPLRDDDNRELGDLIGPDEIQGDSPSAGGKIVGWRVGGRGKIMVVVQWGPKNSAIYREVPESEAPSGFDRNETTCLNDWAQRLGEQKLQGKYEFDNSHRPVLQGVAIAYPPDMEHPQALLTPEGKGQRYTPGSYLIRWTRDGESFYSWETRTTVRRIWKGGNARADKAIHDAFVMSQRNYKAWKDGKRSEADRSPTPDPGLQAPSVTPEATPEPTSTAIPQNNSPSAAPSTSAQPTAPQPASGTIPTGQPASTAGPAAAAAGIPTPAATPEPSGQPQPSAEAAPATTSNESAEAAEEKAREAFTKMMFQVLGVKGTPKIEQATEIAIQWAQNKSKVLG